MPVFPSVEWFEAIAGIINSDSAYHHLGTCDAEVGLEIGDRLFQLTFEAFECTSVREIPRENPPELDFTLSMPFEKWKEMVSNIKQNGRADLHHTLNTLDLESENEFVRADDFYKADKFYRFNQSFQNFFDASARLETRFADAAVAG